MIEQDEIERKFLVSGWDEVTTWPVPILSSTHIRQTYIQGTEEGRSERVRSRGDLGGNRTFTWNAKRFVSPGHYKEEEQEIDEDDYNQMFWKRSDPRYREVVKDRWVFDYEGLTWEMDHFLSAQGIVILEVELPSLDTDLTLPPFLQIERQVTGIKHWSNRSMAKMGWVPFPRLIAGQVWVRGRESFQVLSTEDGDSGIRTRELKFEISTARCPQAPLGVRRRGSAAGVVATCQCLTPCQWVASVSRKPALEFVDVEALLREGWEIGGQ